MTLFVFCTGGRNRTHARGFGDPCTTIILRPPGSSKRTGRETRSPGLLSLAVESMLTGLFREHHKLKTALKGLLVLMRTADFAGLGALHLDHVILRHTNAIIKLAGWAG